MTTPRDHGGGLDAAIAQYGGSRAEWLDLSAGINPNPFPVGQIAPQARTALPDQGAMDRLRWARRIAADAARADALMAPDGKLVGGAHLFRLYHVDDAKAWQDRLARRHIWSRVFSYSQTWLRLGLPDPDSWGQLEAAL